ncbi:hypothetical protein [Streptomyces sp. NPDC054765]
MEGVTTLAYAAFPRRGGDEATALFPERAGEMRGGALADGAARRAPALAIPLGAAPSGTEPAKPTETVQ